MAKIFVSPSSVKPDKITNINGVELYEYLISKHNVNKLEIPMKRKGKLKYVVVHNTEDLANIEDDGRNYIAASVNDNLRGVMSTMYVDDLRAWQLLELNRENWCCSDFYTNTEGGCKAGISIEIIMNGVDGEQNLKARDNGARLAAYYLYKNGLTVENGLVTHTWCINISKGRTGSSDYLNCVPPAGEKLCPYYIIPKWDEFKALVRKYYNALKNPVELFYVRKSWKEAETQLGAFASLDNAKALAEFNYGYKVFNSRGRGCYTPRQYFEKYTVMKKAPVKYAPKTKEKTVDWLDIGVSAAVCHGVTKVAENGTIWTKIRYGASSKYAWIPLSYIMKP